METKQFEIMPKADFERLGGGQIAYVRPIQSEDVQALFPDAPKLTPGQLLWALLNADGTPILLSDSKSAAIAKAWENDMQTFSVH